MNLSIHVESLCMPICNIQLNIRNWKKYKEYKEKYKQHCMSFSCNFILDAINEIICVLFLDMLPFWLTLSYIALKWVLFEN